MKAVRIVSDGLFARRTRTERGRQAGGFGFRKSERLPRVADRLQQLATTSRTLNNPRRLHFDCNGYQLVDFGMQIHLLARSRD
jgi:hypothetical protein